jgi:predicted TIM-barrel fold metal-dependent hydrolase
VYVTTSGNYYEPAFRCTKEAMGIDKILLGTDYPYEDTGECLKFIEKLPLSENEKEKIYFANAAQLGIN